MKARKKDVFQLCATALVVLLLMAVTGDAVGHGYVDMRKNDADNILYMYSGNIQLRMQGSLNEAGTLAQIVRYSETGIQARWTQYASVLLERGEVCFICLAEGDRITGALPAEPFGSRVGKDLKDLSYVYTLAKVVKELVIEGPILLEETGEEVFLFLQPIVDPDNNAYLGEVAVALRRDYVIEQLGLDYLTQKGYDYELWCVNSQTGDKDVISTSNADTDFSYAAKTSFYLPTQWNLSIQPKDGWLSMAGYVQIIGICLAASCALTLLIYCIRRISVQRRQLRELSRIDQQTGLYNREGFLHALEDWPKAGEEGVRLFYFTLEGYDRLSQTVDLETKNAYLKAVAPRLKNFIKSPYLAGRVGESNYVVALQEPMDEAGMDDFAKGPSLELLWKVRLEEKKRFLRVRYRYAVCPVNAEAVEDCLISLSKACYDD